MNSRFKYLACLVSMFGFFMSQAIAQGLINNGAFISNNNAFIYIDGGSAVGNFTNQDAGASIGRVDNTGTIQVTGNWINNSTQNVFTANTGTVEMLGADQSLGGSTMTWFNHLKLLGTGTKTLLVNELVGGGYAAPAGVLSLNDRPLNLGTHTLIVNNPVNTAITRTSGYIISETNSSNNTSIVQWNVGAINAAYVFPFGTPVAPNYIPLTITKASGNTSISASTRQTFTTDNQPWQFTVTQMWSQTIPGPGQVPVVIDRWWDINSPSPFTGSVSFTYRGVENTTTYAPTGTFAGQNWMGTFWNIPVGSGPGVTAGTAVVTIPTQTLGGNTPWVLSNVTAPLPVELLFFTARLHQKQVNLNWSTASQVNCDYFEVQRSTDRENFESISRVSGAGNSTQTITYKDVDERPYNGISYYRLKQVDFDGQFTYSKTELVRNDDEAFEFISAGMFESNLQLGFFCPGAGTIHIHITDEIGRIVFASVIQADEGYNRKDLLMSGASSSLYFVTLNDENAAATRKIFIQ